MKQALKNNADIALLCEIEHPDGTVYLWSGVGTLDYDSKEWLGLGALAGVEGVKQASTLSLNQITFKMAIIEPNMQLLQDFISVNLKGKNAKVWFACFDDEQRVIASPIQILRAKLDYQTFSLSEDGSALISLVGQQGFYKLERALDVSWTPEEQKRTYPDDTGFDMISGLQDKELRWTLA
jgi:hypothetical protein